MGRRRHPLRAEAVRRYAAGEVARAIAEDLNVFTSQVTEWAHAAGHYKRGPRRRIVKLRISPRRLELLRAHFAAKGAVLEEVDDQLFRLRKGTQ